MLQEKFDGAQVNLRSQAGDLLLDDQRTTCRHHMDTNSRGGSFIHSAWEAHLHGGLRSAGLAEVLPGTGQTL